MISEHFTRKEFSCKCNCGFNTVDAELLQILESLRSHFSLPVIITSACRCWLWNHSVRGSDHSQHLIGRAADVKITSIHPDTVADYLESTYPNLYGIGRYDTFTHVDTRSQFSRWDERNS